MYCRERDGHASSKEGVHECSVSRMTVCGLCSLDPQSHRTGKQHSSCLHGLLYQIDDSFSVSSRLTPVG